MKPESRQPVVAQSLGERIAQARRQLGVFEGRDILVPELAKQLGVSAESVYSWESGKTVPREDALAKLARFLGVTPAYLRYGVQDSAPLDRLAPEPELPASDLLKQKAPASKASAKKRRA